MKTKEKICHLHLLDVYNAKATLVCWLDAGAIQFVFYATWGSSGTPLAISNLQADLPIEAFSGESKEAFTKRIITVINQNSVFRVAHEVQPVKFA